MFLKKLNAVYVYVCVDTHILHTHIKQISLPLVEKAFLGVDWLATIKLVLCGRQTLCGPTEWWIFFVMHLLVVIAKVQEFSDIQLILELSFQEDSFSLSFLVFFFINHQICYHFFHFTY